jgi:hypothetical protein
VFHCTLYHLWSSIETTCNVQRNSTGPEHLGLVLCLCHSTIALRLTKHPHSRLPSHHSLFPIIHSFGCHMSRQALAQAQGRPNTLQPTQLNINGVGLLAWPLTAQSMSASSLSLMGTQITGPGTNGGAQSASSLSSMGTQITGPGTNSGAQSQSGTMSAPLTQGSMNSVASSSILTQSVGFLPMRRPTTEEVTSAKGWVDDSTSRREQLLIVHIITFSFNFPLLICLIPSPQASRGLLVILWFQNTCWSQYTLSRLRADHMPLLTLSPDAL